MKWGRDKHIMKGTFMSFQTTTPASLPLSLFLSPSLSVNGSVILMLLGAPTVTLLSTSVTAYQLS